jgi:hypothetical protein
MNRLSFVACLIGLVLIGLTKTASAQRFGSRSNTLVSIAANEAVQKHLGLNDEAVAKLNALNDDYRSASQKELTALGIDYSALSDLPAAERTMEMRKVTEKTAEVNRKLMSQFLPKLTAILTAEQIERVRQVQIQAGGMEVWLEPEIAKQLELTGDQQAQFTSLRNDYNRRQQQLDGDFQQRFAKIRELNAERDAQASKLLSERQTTTLEALKGPPFDVSQLGFGRRRGNN